MNGIEAWEAHISACRICQNQASGTASGLCLYGFRAELGRMNAIWELCRSIQHVTEKNNA